MYAVKGKVITFACESVGIPLEISMIETEPSGSTEYVEFGSPSFAVSTLVKLLLKQIISGIAPTVTCFWKIPFASKNTTEPFN